jgi:hypothetical protein
MMSEICLVMAGFLTRAAGLVMAAMVYFYFRRSQGPVIPAFRVFFFSLSFLLLWVTAASVVELLGYIDHAGRVVELSGAWIWVPNFVVDVFLGRLLWRLYAHGQGGHYGRR